MGLEAFELNLYGSKGVQRVNLGGRSQHVPGIRLFVVRVHRS